MEKAGNAGALAPSPANLSFDPRSSVLIRGKVLLFRSRAISAMTAIRHSPHLVILSVGGATEGSDAESKDPEDLSRDHAAAGRSPHTTGFDFQFWQSPPDLRPSAQICGKGFFFSVSPCLRSEKLLIISVKCGLANCQLLIASCPQRSCSAQSPPADTPASYASSTQ
jgi:hypothetical protein